MFARSKALASSAVSQPMPTFQISWAASTEHASSKPMWKSALATFHVCHTKSAVFFWLTVWSSQSGNLSVTIGSNWKGRSTSPSLNAQVMSVWWEFSLTAKSSHSVNSLEWIKSELTCKFTLQQTSRMVRVAMLFLGHVASPSALHRKASGSGLRSTREWRTNAPGAKAWLSWAMLKWASWPPAVILHIGWHLPIESVGNGIAILLTAFSVADIWMLTGRNMSHSLTAHHRKDWSSATKVSHCKNLQQHLNLPPWLQHLSTKSALKVPCQPHSQMLLQPQAPSNRSCTVGNTDGP